MIRARERAGGRGSILIDVGDGDTTAAYLAALRSGMSVVTANKVPSASEHAVYQTLRDAAATGGGQIRGEATVGAGLPVMDTIEQLVRTGDRITAIEGCLSGSLTYVMGELSQGRGLAEVVQEATDKGYLEPDPSADLCGEDVRRKAVILARAAGFDPADADVLCQGLADRALLGQGRSAFLAALPSVSDALASMMTRSVHAGRVLRYVARVTPGGVQVGPRDVEPGSPMGTLTGTDNLVVIHSERYRDSPLVIRGPGAGADVTAMAVLTDVLRLIAERG